MRGSGSTRQHSNKLIRNIELYLRQSIAIFIRERDPSVIQRIRISRNKGIEGRCGKMKRVESYA